MRSAPDPVQRGDAAYQARHAFWQFYAALILLVGLVAFGLAWLARRDDVRFEREEALGDLTEQAAIVRDVLGPDDETTKHIPVLILSNSSREEDKRRAIELGAQGYYVKANLSLKALGDEIARLG